MKARVRGIALLEVLAAIAVLALGGLAAAGLQARGAQVFEQAGRERLALHLAQGMLERLRAAQHVRAEDAQQWNTQVAEAFGASATGQFSPSGGTLLLQVQWPATETVFSLQGRVVP